MGGKHRRHELKRPPTGSENCSDRPGDGDAPDRSVCPFHQPDEDRRTGRIPRDIRRQAGTHSNIRLAPLNRAKLVKFRTKA